MPAIYLHHEGVQKGPYTPEELRGMIAAGLAPETPAWHEGLTDWTPVATVLAAFSSPAPAGPPPVPVAPPLPTPRRAPSKGLSAGWIVALVGGGIAFVAFYVIMYFAVQPFNKSIQREQQRASLRLIDIAMSEYANDHNGAYPDGHTSTEVFQKLLDGKYVDNPAIFYLPISGKTFATTDKLVAENVCYDVTSGVTADSSNDVPLVYSQGYNLTYTAGSVATPDKVASTSVPGIGVVYKSGVVRFFDPRSDGDVAEVVPAAFDPGKGGYQQLKP